MTGVRACSRNASEGCPQAVRVILIQLCAFSCAKDVFGTCESFDIDTAGGVSPRVPQGEAWAEGGADGVGVRGLLEIGGWAPDSRGPRRARRLIRHVTPTQGRSSTGRCP